MPNNINILLGSDHKGFEIKKSLIKCCEANGWHHDDVGCYTSDSCDYPDIANNLCEKLLLSKKSYPKLINYGVLICGSGIGMSIVANRIPNIHAALVHNLKDAELSRQHNNANILVLSERLTKPSLAKEIFQLFVSTLFLNGRHLRRTKLIDL